MPLPEILRDNIDAARSMISRAHNLDGSLQAGNAQAMLINARAFVVEDPSIDAAFDEAGEQIGLLRQARALDEARASALQTLDRLEQSLSGARPNEHAKALGVDWF